MVDVRSLQPSDLEGCAGLLEARHDRHRLSSPLLGPLSRQAAVAEVEALLALPGATAAVAVSDGAVAGYLIGSPKPGAAWGANAWVEPAGSAGQHLQDLYAFLASAWVGARALAHYVLVPACDATPWFELGFGRQHVFAASVPSPSAPDPRIRRAVRADVPALAALDVVLDEHLVASPVFSGLTPVSLAESHAEWETGIDDPAYTVFVAEVAGTVVGSAIGCDVAMSSANRGLIVPDRAALFGFAAVLPSARGLGLGLALGRAVESWAHAAGYPVICSDWRSTNLTATRSWPRLGYQPTFLRLHRLVGH